jgi:hypothetical protein
MTLSCCAWGGSIGLTGTPVLHTYNTGQLVNGD